MLFLAQSDQHKHSLGREVLRLDAEANLLAEFLMHVAEDRQLQIKVTGQATVRANRILLQRAVTNLLSNAIRYADEMTTINVNIEQSQATVTLSVTNAGKAISQTDAERIFERFYRVDADRSHDSGGTGLGRSQERRRPSHRAVTSASATNSS